MGDIKLGEDLLNINSLINELEKEESNILYATKNNPLNSYYFVGKKEYFYNVISNFKDIRKNLINSKLDIDPILYENIINDLDNFIESLEISSKEIDSIIEKYRNHQEIDFYNLNNSFYENKKKSDIFLDQVSKAKLVNETKINNEIKQEIKEDIKENMKDRNLSEDSYAIENDPIFEESGIDEETIDEIKEEVQEELKEQKIDEIDDEKIEEIPQKDYETEEVIIEKKEPSIEELMEKVRYRTNEAYSHNLMEFRVNHEISLIDNQIMVLENSAKIKDLIEIEKLKAKKESLEKYLEKFISKTNGVIVNRDGLLYSNDIAIEIQSQNLNELKNNKYNSKLFNGVNNLQVFITETYINMLNKSNTKLKIHQRTAILNKFNNKYANISKISTLKGITKGSIEKLKILKNQLVNEANNISKDFQSEYSRVKTI